MMGRADSLLVLLLAVAAFGCGETGPIDFNPNFPSLGDLGIQPTASVDPTSAGQVIDIAPSVPDDTVPNTILLSGALGAVADQNPEHVICVVTDGAGGNADLAVCDAETASQEATSADRVCPEETGDSHCVSNNPDEAPDFCEVTGARDYVFSLINRSATEVRVAYQVINVTNLPNKSCDDLNITEDSVTADTL